MGTTWPQHVENIGYWQMVPSATFSMVPIVKHNHKSGPVDNSIFTKVTGHNAPFLHSIMSTLCVSNGL